MEKVILVDLDDTLEDFINIWVQRLNELYPEEGHYTPEDVRDWSMSSVFPTVSKKDKLKCLYEEEFWRRVKPLPGAVDYLSKLVDEGFNVFIVTATDYRIAEEKIEAIVKRYFPFIDEKHIILAYYKHMIKADILVDDNIDNLLKGDYQKILFDSYHNSADDLSKYDKRIYRAYTWKHCYKLIHELMDVDMNKNTLKLLDWHNRIVDTEFSLDDMSNVEDIHIKVISGDELAAIYFKDGSIQTFDSSNSRVMSSFDGDYYLYKNGEWKIPIKDFIDRADSYSLLWR